MENVYESEIKRIRELTDQGDLQELMRSFDGFNKDYFRFKPDKEKFPCPQNDSVIDEEKSVKWNREEITKLQNAYNEERDRLFNERNRIQAAYKEDLARLMGAEFGLSPEEAQVVWCRAWEDSHSGGIYDVCSRFSELADVAWGLKAIWEKNAAHQNGMPERDESGEIER